MMMVLLYGCIEFAEEQELDRHYDDQIDMMSLAESYVQESFDDNPSKTEEGYTYEVQHDKDRVVVFDPEGKEYEWWKVVPVVKKPKKESWETTMERWAAEG